jgi:hypothetical protein
MLLIRTLASPSPLSATLEALNMKKIIFLMFAFFLVNANAGEKEALVQELSEMLMPQGMLEDAANRMTAQLAQQDPVFERNKELVKKWYMGIVTGSEYKLVVQTIYLESFTKEELIDLVSFYRSKTGQKARKQLPIVTQKIMGGTSQLAEKYWPQVVERIKQAEASN